MLFVKSKQSKKWKAFLSLLKWDQWGNNNGDCHLEEEIPGDGGRGTKKWNLILEDGVSEDDLVLFLSHGQEGPLGKSVHRKRKRKIWEK